MEPSKEQDLVFYWKLQFRSISLKQDQKITKMRIEQFKKELNSQYKRKNNHSYLKEPNCNNKKYANELLAHKSRAKSQKLEMLSRKKVTILRPVQEDSGAFVSHFAVKMVHKRCRDDLDYMRFGEKSQFMRFNQNSDHLPDKNNYHSSNI